MLLSRHRLGLGMKAIRIAVVALAVVLGGPALAGEQGGNLQPVGTLLLELDAIKSQFRLDDLDGNPDDDLVQKIFDYKLASPSMACLAGLAPPVENVVPLPSDPETPATLVSFQQDEGEPLEIPNPTDWGIDTGKLALGSRTKKGTGCGQIEGGEFARLEAKGLILAGHVSLQIEAKQDAIVRVSFYLDGDSDPVGTRCLLTGTSVSNPPSGLEACDRFGKTRPDGGPDSGNNDDGFWTFEDAPPHNVEVFEILQNAEGSYGKLSLKGGGEYETPSANRSEWTAFEADGLLACGDGFSCEGNEDCTSAEGTVSGNRTDTGTGDACTEPIPFELKFDGEKVTFNYRASPEQNPGITLDVKWETEAAQLPIDPTVLSYDPNGVVNCDRQCSNSDPEMPTSCDSDSDCDPGNTCVLAEPASCIPLGICVGTPIRSCSNDPTRACQEDRDCGTCSDNGASCQDDTECTDGSCLLGASDTCRLVDLVAPGRCSDDGASCQGDMDCHEGSTCVVGFPDLVPSTTDTTEFGCVCEEDVLYLGGRCSNDGTSCQIDSNCGVGNTCEDQIAVDQCLFFTGDATFLRGGKKSN